MSWFDDDDDAIREAAIALWLEQLGSPDVGQAVTACDEGGISKSSGLLRLTLANMTALWFVGVFGVFGVCFACLV